MKQTKRLVLAVFIAIACLTVSCSKSNETEEMIIGKWSITSVNGNPPETVLESFSWGFGLSHFFVCMGWVDNQLVSYVGETNSWYLKDDVLTILGFYNEDGTARDTARVILKSVDQTNMVWEVSEPTFLPLPSGNIKFSRIPDD